MAIKHLEVETYKLYFRPTPAPSWGFAGGFAATQCYGWLLLRSKTSTDRFFLAIVDNSVTTLPDARTDISRGVWRGTAAIRQENLSGMLDLLRNEKPIYMTLSDSVPLANMISTDPEPIGEGTDTSP